MKARVRVGGEVTEEEASDDHGGEDDDQVQRGELERDQSLHGTGPTLETDVGDAPEVDRDRNRDADEEADRRGEDGNRRSREPCVGRAEANAGSRVAASSRTNGVMQIRPTMPAHVRA